MESVGHVRPRTTLRSAGSAPAQPPPEYLEAARTPGQRAGHRIEVAAVDVAPSPALVRLERCDHWVTGCFEVLQRMRILRILAAADMAAGKTNTKLVPPHAEGHAFFAAARAGFHSANFAEMRAGHDHVRLSFFGGCASYVAGGDTAGRTGDLFSRVARPRRYPAPRAAPSVRSCCPRDRQYRSTGPRPPRRSASPLRRRVCRHS